MEFYIVLPFLNLALLLGFNSQRDGILHKFNRHVGSDRNCFNSQRDGILRIIPTEHFATQEVSIPNGMEFYSNKTTSRFYGSSFNSQRDGILRAQATL